MKTSLLTIAAISSSIIATSLHAQPRDRPTPPDPETVVLDLFEYDADENDSLSQAELAAGFAELRKKHGGPRPEGRKDKMKKNRPEGEKPGKGKKGQRRGGGSPEKMSERLIENHDTNGDSELNAEEMLEAITAMHERRGPRGGGRKGPPAPESSE